MTRKEAIDKVYGMSGTKEQHEALEFLIPEVRELREFYERQQEDKRIRKELVEAFEALDIDSSWNGIPVKSILAWLKDQKPAEWSEEDEEKLKAICTYLRDYSRLAKLSDKLRINEYCDFLKSLRPQKPDASKLENFDPVDVLNRIKTEWPMAWEKAVGKQEWDEFDEDCLKRAIWYVENPAPSVVKDTNLALWLKSLPERKNLPPKQEWNKEDESMLKWIEDILLIADDDLSDKLNGRVSPITDSAYSSMKLCIAKCLSWLKSLPLNLKKKNEDVAKLCSKEWSQEDEDRIRQIERIAQQAGCTQKLQEEIHDWLKSLRPQPRPEWSEEDEKLFWGLTAYVPNEELERLGVTRDDILKKLKSIRLQPTQLKEAYKEGFQTARHATALAFMNYCDKIRPNGKMCLSNGECEEIRKHFLVGDWEKIERYLRKYSWKPSEEQMKAMSYFVRKHQATANRATTKWPEFEAFKSLYNDLKKRM